MDVRDRCLGIVTLVSALLVWAAAGGAVAPPAAARDLGPNCPIPFRLLPTDNPWNTAVDTLPVDPNSADYIARMGAATEIHADFGTVWNGAPNGIPYMCVSGTQPKVPIVFTEYGDESDPGPYPLPSNAPIEGGRSSTADRHVLVLDVDHQMLYELYHAYPQADGSWQAGSGAVFDLASNGLRPDGWTSADAAGLPMLPGLTHYDEVVGEGEIDHALRFTVSETQRAYIYPATHYASDDADPDLPPMGLRVRLKASVDISGFPAEVQVICRALKKYGMIVADNGGPWYVSGAPDSRWDDDALHAVSQLQGSDFEVVDTRGLQPDGVVVDAGDDVALWEGDTLTRDGSYADDASTSWTATVDYGDGDGVEPLALVPGGTLSLSHLFADDGTRLVTVTVAGDGGTSGSARFSARVRNVPPSVRAGGGAALRCGVALVRRVRVSDPGADTFRARVSWGDGSAIRRRTLGTRTTFFLRHVFRRPGTYAVAVTVRDDDGGRGVDRLRVVVR